mgnify:CR=1 FL=1
MIAARKYFVVLQGTKQILFDYLLMIVEIIFDIVIMEVKII